MHASAGDARRLSTTLQSAHQSALKKKKTIRCDRTGKSFVDAGQQYRDTRSRTPTRDTCPCTNQRSCSTNGYQRFGISTRKKCMNIRKTYVVKILHVFEREFQSIFATISRRWPVRQRHRRVAMPSSTIVVDVAQNPKKCLR